MAETTPGPAASAGTAMQQAVAAEQEAGRAIAAAEAQARADVEAARARARGLLNAVPARIARLRTRGESAVRKALAALRADEEAAALRLRDAALPPAALEDAIADVVRRLTGEEPPAGTPP